jgi:hypothetical protein
MQNYEATTVNVVVNLVDKTPVTITGVTVSGKTYDGKAVSYAGTPSGVFGDNQSYNGSYEYIWVVKDGKTLSGAPKNAGTYTLTIKVPDDNTTYMGETEPIEFTIAKKALTVKPKDVSIYNGTALPTSFTLEYVGLVSGDTFTPEGTLKYALKNGENTLSDSKTNGTYTIAWTNKDAVTVTDGNYSITKSDGKLTISSHHSGGGGGSPSAPTATPSPTTTASGGTVKTTVTATTNQNGEAKTSLRSDTVKGALEKAVADARESGEPPRMEIHVNAGTDASKVETTLPKAAIKSVVENDLASLTLSNPVASVTFDNGVLETIAKEATGDVTFSASQIPDSKLSDAARQIVGERPVYDFSVKSGTETISHFDGAVAISMPYTPGAGEDTNAIVAYYINDNGEPELMQNCRYDAGAGALVFTTTHFSTYAVGYNKVSFSDVSASDWYAGAVGFLAARNITGGTTQSTFSPDATLTRGQFITLLMRAYSIEPEDSSAENFSDAGNTYYTGYLAAARKLGISNGVGDNKFAPEQAVSRQEMFTLLYNSLKVVDALPEGDSGNTLSDFSDSGSISSYAQEAMAYLVNAGTVGGINGQLMPEATTTRAQMAQVLYNLLSK